MHAVAVASAANDLYSINLTFCLNFAVLMSRADMAQMDLSYFVAYNQSTSIATPTRLPYMHSYKFIRKLGIKNFGARTSIQGK